MFLFLLKDMDCVDTDAASLAAVNLLRLVGPHGTDAGHFHAKRVLAPGGARRDGPDGRFGVLAIEIHKRGIHRVPSGVQHADTGISAQRAGFPDECRVGAFEPHLHFAARGVRHERAVLPSPMCRAPDFPGGKHLAPFQGIRGAERAHVPCLPVFRHG